MPQLSRPRVTRRYQPKPPRLRSACNQCNASKVKCTGERQGCTRCKALNIQCIYAESRVGKVQGQRPKERRMDSGRPMVEETAVAENASIEVAVASSAEQNLSSPWPESWSAQETWAFDMPMLDDPAPTFGAMLEDAVTSTGTSSDIPSAVVDNIAQIEVELSNSEYDLDYMGNTPADISGDSSPSSSEHLPFSSATTLTPPIPMNAIPNRPAGLPTSCSCAGTVPHQPSEKDRGGIAARPGEDPQLSDQDRVKLDSSCTLACLQILAKLENYLLSDLRALDLIIDGIHKAGVDLKKLVDLQQHSRSERCILLFTAVVSQIMDLLGSGLKPLSFHNGADSPSGILSGMQASFIPSVGLGGFSLLAEDQDLWRTRILRKECKHIAEVLFSVMELVKLGPTGVSFTPQMAEQRLAHLRNHERKLEDILTKELKKLEHG